MWLLQDVEKGCENGHLAQREAGGWTGAGERPSSHAGCSQEAECHSGFCFLFKGSELVCEISCLFRYHDPASVLCLTSDGAFANVHGIIVPKHLYMGSVYSVASNNFEDTYWKGNQLYRSAKRVSIRPVAIRVFCFGNLQRRPGGLWC